MSKLEEQKIVTPSLVWDMYVGSNWVETLAIIDGKVVSLERVDGRGRLGKFWAKLLGYIFFDA